MRIILIRHGRTIAREQNVYEGEKGGLSKEGKKQIKKLAIRLKNEKIDYIYSSPLKRAVDTANAIIKFHPSLHLDFLEDLRERDTKKYEGKPFSVIDWTNPPKDIETEASLTKRAKKLVDEIYRGHKKGTVVLIGHNSINKSIIHIMTGQAREGIKQSNTGVSIFEINENKKHKIHCLNCTKHLE